MRFIKGNIFLKSMQKVMLLLVFTWNIHMYIHSAKSYEEPDQQYSEFIYEPVLQDLGDIFWLWYNYANVKLYNYIS